MDDTRCEGGPDVNFADDVDWPGVLDEYLARPGMADPRGPRRSTYVCTMLLLEAGLREIDEQLSGRSTAGRDELGWARITRQLVVGRAARIARAELSAADRCDLSVGEGAFKYRWQGCGGMADYLACLVRYSCLAPRWRSAIEYGPRRAMELLPMVRAGEVDLSDVITRIATYDLRLRTRIARFWLFQLALMMDVRWRAPASQAYREFLATYTRLWAPVYERGALLLDVRLRPGMEPLSLSSMVSALISGYAERLAGSGDTSAATVDAIVAEFVVAVQAVVLAAIDHGDRRPVPAALGAALGGAPPP
jgi:hypothetical protein